VLSKRARWWVEAAERLADGLAVLCDVDDLADDEWAPIRPAFPVPRQPVGRPVPWDPGGERRNNWAAFQHIDGYELGRVARSKYYAIRAAQASIQAPDEPVCDRRESALDTRLSDAHRLAAEAVAHWRRAADEDEPDPRAAADELAAQVPLLWDVVGDPARPAAFDPRWRTADVVGLARGIYEERAFDRLPLLADALMDAGCDQEDLRAHCRSAGPHVRGCWAVDLVRGRARSAAAPCAPEADEFERWYEPARGRHRRGR
jgi:hypothetical protein